MKNEQWVFRLDTAELFKALTSINFARFDGNVPVLLMGNVIKIAGAAPFPVYAQENKMTCNSLVPADHLYAIETTLSMFPDMPLWFQLTKRTMTILDRCPIPAPAPESPKPIYSTTRRK